MTEDEAKEKWCPMARVTLLSDSKLVGSANRAGLGGRSIEEDPKCLGSECMMWVTNTKQVISSLNPTVVDDEPCDPPDGHCGLAQ